jgi:cytochrome c553
MQSRSIDSYIHAIHSFQDFDIGDVNFADPVETMRHELHIEHTYPNFTIKNCKSCHNEGAFEVPDQYSSLPGVLSAADILTTKDRKIGAVPAYVTGPASRACGSCHRAELINEDEAGELVAFNQHTKQGGYLIEGGDNTTTILDQVIDYIMGLFK